MVLKSFPVYMYVYVDALAVAAANALSAAATTIVHPVCLLNHLTHPLCLIDTSALVYLDHCGPGRSWGALIASNCQWC